MKERRDHGMKPDVRQHRIDEDEFMKWREKELSIWPTGKEVILDEAVEYQRCLPESKSFLKVIERLRREGKTVVFPRAGTPILEDEIELNRTLVESGVPLIPVTSDSYTRGLQLEKAQQALEESIRTGKPILNGYPIINHGVKNTRKVVEACNAAFNPRLGSRICQKLGAEIAFASGMTAMAPSIFQLFGNYEKKSTLAQCIRDTQYVFRLMGYYAERGPIITADIHGWNPNAVFPLSLHLSTIILTALIGAEQGCKSVVPLIEFQGYMAQDLAWFNVGPKLIREYLDKFNFRDVLVPGAFANQIPLYPVPQDQGGVFAYMNYTAVIAALAKAEACYVRTIDEGAGIPTAEAHAISYRSANWIFDVIRTQDFHFESPEVKIEEEMAEKEIRAIVDKIIEMGEGDVVVGSIKAVESGFLDSPFPANINVKDKVMGVRDRLGACRFLEFGNLPLPKEVKEFHVAKVAEREADEGIKMDYSVSLKDFWALSKGSIKGMPPYDL
jgi:methylaspartate mutase epsilon subunit